MIKIENKKAEAICASATLELELTPSDFELVDSEERSSGTENHYSAEISDVCKTCSKEVRMAVELWEYPEGILNSGPDVESDSLDEIKLPGIHFEIE